jgi:hemerythrin-like metal-binding protein
MPKVYWEPVYSVNVREIDEQHQRLINFMNEAYDKIEQQQFSDEDLAGFFAKLSDHANNHFGTEEKYFTQFNYDGAPVHIDQHNIIKAEIEKFGERYKTTPSQEIIFETLQFLDDWLFVHIMEFDKKYVKCFNDHGLF